jgi:putative ABC transport system permease protein
VIDAGGDGARDAVVPLVYVPVGLAQTLLGRRSYDIITVRTNSVGVTTAVAKDIRQKLRVLHGLTQDTLDDFRVETQSVSALPSMGSDPRLARAVHSNTAGFEQASWEEMAKSLRQAGRTFTLLLAGAAAVSLLVGGIGVMNIMLVSVTARTREIGLRMALGARAGDVMLQFLVEAVTLAALGGLIGLLLGMAGLTVTEYGLHWATSASPAMLAAALAMAAITGMVFGFVPARRAAFLDPVIALRSE